ncbi:MAG TPA: helix-turn-helix domain-containing protein [Cytophagales bacterium]|nr:helix-turn-helix domain-containing protein [Cytophagales bacterium]
MVHFQHIQPHAQLQGYIEKLWVLETVGRFPEEDMKIIVPNGLIKMVIPYRNGLFGSMHGCAHVSAEHHITLIGVSDIPSRVDYLNDAPTGSIGVEFSPLGAYRFFKINLSEIKNKIFHLESVIGNVAKELEERVSNVESVAGKVSLVQQFLISQMSKDQGDVVFDYCIQKIISHKGLVSVKSLESASGYSTRWINMKFNEKVGVSPKNLSSIIRFMQFYQALAVNNGITLLEKDFYSFYYDQSHFIKEFKRFTGLSPMKFIDAKNEFGKIFYKG